MTSHSATVPDLRLKVPDGIDVTPDGIPGPFLRWNDKREQPTLEVAKQFAGRVPKWSVEAQRAQKRIEAFLKNPCD